MKSLINAAVLLAVVSSFIVLDVGCTVRETVPARRTVVERPVVVEHPVVRERAEVIVR